MENSRTFYLGMIYKKNAGTRRFSFGLGRVLPEARKFWLGRVGFSGLVVDSFEFTRIFRGFFTELR